jgi:hypothetical protein
MKPHHGKVIPVVLARARNLVRAGVASWRRAGLFLGPRAPASFPGILATSTTSRPRFSNAFIDAGGESPTPASEGCRRHR